MSSRDIPLPASIPPNVPPLAIVLINGSSVPLMMQKLPRFFLRPKNFWVFKRSLRRADEEHGIRFGDYRGGPAGLAAAAEAKRLLTATVRTRGSRVKLFPVRTSGPVPKRNLPECMQVTAGLTVKPPIRCGEVIVSNLLQSGQDLIPSEHFYHQKSVRSGNANFEPRATLT